LFVKLTAQIKLHPTPEQADALKRTLERANAACDHISRTAWTHRTFRQFDLHKLAYREAREKFGLSAQMAVRCISKVADAYKLDKRTQREFSPTGAIAYDSRILAFKLAKNTVSIWTMDDRQTIPFVCGEHQRAQLATQKGECDLMLIRGEFYLAATCEIEEAAPIETTDALGVDFGVVNIAVDSDGQGFNGSAAGNTSRPVNNVRFRHRRLRAKLQHKGTKSTRRRLRKLSGKERRFAKDVNHTISKQIAAKAKDTNRAIALEDLKGIRLRVTARRPQRATLHSWSFHQLKLFVEYKALRVGVPVFLVDPRNTSRTCPRCGCIDKANRRSQSNFSCVSCGFAGLADHIAATNISARGRAHVNAPNVSTQTNHAISPKLVCASGTSPRVLLAGS
jgi:IS605 OrfB family transposase